MKISSENFWAKDVCWERSEALSIYGAMLARLKLCPRRKKSPPLKILSAFNTCIYSVASVSVVISGNVANCGTVTDISSAAVLVLGEETGKNFLKDFPIKSVIIKR